MGRDITLASLAALLIKKASGESADERLLVALASGVPVIATRACGLPEQAGLTLIDSDELTNALAAFSLVRGD